MSHKKERVFFIMGVSGTGKSTIGKLLSETLHIPFFDGDDYHPAANIEKMASGKSLNDDDRHGWLLKLNELGVTHKDKGVVIVCSSLKRKYRDLLTKDIPNHFFIYLEGSFELIYKRLNSRENHFMPINLLQSQFDTLEVPKQPESVITVPISSTPDEIIKEIINQIN